MTEKAKPNEIPNLVLIDASDLTDADAEAFVRALIGEGPATSAAPSDTGIDDAKQK